MVSMKRAMTAVIVEGCVSSLIANHILNQRTKALEADCESRVAKALSDGHKTGWDDALSNPGIVAARYRQYTSTKN